MRVRVGEAEAQGEALEARDVEVEGVEEALGERQPEVVGVGVLEGAATVPVGVGRAETEEKGVAEGDRLPVREAGAGLREPTKEGEGRGVAVVLALHVPSR